MDACRDDDVGYLCVGSQPEHHRVRNNRQIHYAPGLTAIRGATDSSGDARNGIAIANKHNLGVVRLYEHAPAIRLFVVFVEFGKLVLAPALPFVGAGANPVGCRVEERRFVPQSQRHAVDISVHGIFAQSDELTHSIAAVSAFVYAIHFDAYPDRIDYPGNLR